jgi:cell division septal protein FtsQ
MPRETVVTMENESAELPSTDAALTEVADDRRPRVRGVTRTGAWFYPGFAILAAIMVWAPAIGSVGQFSVVSFLPR